MDSLRVRAFVDTFRIPPREFLDWGQLRAAATKDGAGIVFYTGEPPEDVAEPLNTTALTFRLAASWVVAYLAANLQAMIVPADTTARDSD